jgi:hypothetical protein
MDQFTNHFDVITGDSNRSERTTVRGVMNPVIDVFIKRTVQLSSTSSAAVQPSRSAASSRA